MQAVGHVSSTGPFEVVELEDVVPELAGAVVVVVVVVVVVPAAESPTNICDDAE